jgi:hypothetical protein
MLKKGLFVGLAIILLGLGIVIPALAQSARSPSTMPKLSAALGSQGKASLVVSPAVVTGDSKNMPLTILGSGFTPGQEVFILIDMGGVVSDISYLMKPTAKANEFGAFAGDVNFARMWKKKLVKEGAYSISAMGMDGTIIATAPVRFVAPPEKK